MSEFTIRSESVDVEQIMKQIRQRILEKRGADYTEDQIRELASVRLEKFLEPRNLRSDLLEQFRKSRPAVNTEPPAITPPYTAEEADIYATHRGALRFLRKLFGPLLKLMVNLNPLLHVIHKQSEFNVMLLKREARRKIEFDKSRAEWNALYYEVLHNLVLETTRMGIEAQNLRMRVESLSSRLDFSERRVRALEGVVQYRPEVIQAPARRERDREDDEPMPAAPQGGASGEGFVPTSSQPNQGGGNQGQGQGDGSRKRRRRRRGRRGGQGLPGGPVMPGGAPQQAGPDGGESFENGDADGPDDGSDDFDGPDPQEAAEAMTADAAPAAPYAPTAQDEAAAADTPVAPDAPAAPSSDDNGEQ
jgi:hypothetical protein